MGHHKMEHKMQRTFPPPLQLPAQHPPTPKCKQLEPARLNNSCSLPKVWAAPEPGQTQSSICPSSQPPSTSSELLSPELQNLTAFTQESQNLENYEVIHIFVGFVWFCFWWVWFVFFFFPKFKITFCQKGSDGRVVKAVYCVYLLWSYRFQDVLWISKCKDPDPVLSLKSEKPPSLTSVGIQARFHITSCPEKNRRLSWERTCWRNLKNSEHCYIKSSLAHRIKCLCSCNSWISSE